MPKLARVSSSRIRELREQRHLTQHDLASALRRHGFGTTQTTVSRWEGGQVPHSSVLRALAAVLGVEIAELFSGDDEEDRVSRSTMLETLYAELGTALGRVSV